MHKWTVQLQRRGPNYSELAFIEIDAGGEYEARRKAISEYDTSWWIVRLHRVAEVKL